MVTVDDGDGDCGWWWLILWWLMMVIGTVNDCDCDDGDCEWWWWWLWWWWLTVIVTVNDGDCDWWWGLMMVIVTVMMVSLGGCDCDDGDWLWWWWLMMVTVVMVIVTVMMVTVMMVTMVTDDGDCDDGDCDFDDGDCDDGDWWWWLWLWWWWLMMVTVMMVTDDGGDWWWWLRLWWWWLMMVIATDDGDCDCDDGYWWWGLWWWWLWWWWLWWCGCDDGDCDCDDVTVMMVTDDGFCGCDVPVCRDHHSSEVQQWLQASALLFSWQVWLQPFFCSVPVMLWISLTTSVVFQLCLCVASRSWTHRQHERETFCDQTPSQRIECLEQSLQVQESLTSTSCAFDGSKLVYFNINEFISDGLPWLDSRCTDPHPSWAAHLRATERRRRSMMKTWIQLKRRRDRRTSVLVWRPVRTYTFSLNEDFCCFLYSCV